MTDEGDEMSAASRGSHAGLRDHFAAAALAGLLAAPTDKDRSMGYWARLAYEAADAMLRQRVAEHAPTNPDAARHEQEDEIVRLRAEIEMLRRALARVADQDATFSVIGGNMIVDVDAKLTDAEREAIEVAAKWCEEPMHPIHSKASLEAMLAADTLRGLLKRLG